MTRTLVATIAFTAGFVRELFWHGVRVALWAIAVVAIAALLGLPVDWRLLVLVVAANLVGLVVYPAGRNP